MESCLKVLLSSAVVTLLATGHANALQTINYDFGSGPAYVGDDGPLSRPGGTYWSKVPAAGLVFDDDIIRDEFNQPTLGFAFSPEHTWGPGLSWVDVSLTGGGPLSSGITPSGGEGGMLAIARVREFEEMVIYARMLGGPGGSDSFGFAYTFFDSNVQQSLPFPTSATGGFPGVGGGDYYRFQESPPRPWGGLGEAPTINLQVPQGIAILAVQIRGEFRIGPEPTSMSMVGVLLAIGMVRRKRD